MQGSENTDVSPQTQVGRLLARGVARARWSLLWERIWPPLAAFLTLCGLFLAVSWLGLWLWLPPIGRAVGVALFGVMALAALVQLVRIRIPTVGEALLRLDRRSGLPHRPAVALTDRLAANDSDAITQALWRVHVERAMAAARKLKAGWPAPHLPARDPIAIRGLVLLLAVATFFSAGGDRERRIAAAFNWQGVVAPANYRIDAWVAPPPYTQRPPVLLQGLRPGEVRRAAGPVTVPANSVLVIRASGATGLNVVLRGGVKADEKTDAAAQPAAAGTEERRYLIAEQGEVTLRGIGDPVTWTFVAVPDRAPAIALTKDPEPQARGSLMLNYKVEDDYGVSEARALFELKPQLDEFGMKTGGFKTPRPLFEAPDMPLMLPQARTRNGVGQTLRDLSTHPWAGADVVLTLRALDEGGNEGFSEPFDMRLPERLFIKPMARALIEQRRVLALDAEAKPRVLTALDALAMAPEVFQIEASVYLGLRSIYWQLSRAKSDDSLRDVVARLWDMATKIEDGNLSDVEAALRAAQERLREALERGASEEEIKKLTDELRAALDKFLQALAEEMRKNPQQMARPMDPNARQLRSQDLKNMIDRLEQLARSGAKDAAQRLLQELQQMLENLQMARPGQQGDQDSDDMMSALDELGNMIREQQQLRDRTFRQGQDQRRERQRGQQGQRGQQNQQDMGELRQNQQALREQLQKLLEQLKQRGMGQQGEQGQNGMDQLGKAGEAMGEAEGQLGDGNADGAVGSQGRALEALRRGAQGMAQAMQQQGPGQGPGPGQPGRPQGRAQQDTDPLGRPLRQGRDYSDDQTVKVPGEIDVQRARRILDELRRRFADPARPQIELDYIERLLKGF